MIGIYFSGTGNTKYCVETFIKFIGNQGHSYPIESEDASKAIIDHDTIILGYPVYFSNMPKIVRDFIDHHQHDWEGKKIFIIATMGLFSGDGTGCAARLLKRYGANIIGGLQVKMPDCIGDEKVLKKTLDHNRRIVQKAAELIQRSVEQFNCGKPPQHGLSLWSHGLGLFGQRLWFYNKTKEYTDSFKVNNQKCIGCGQCVKICPMQNLILIDKHIESRKKCTMCYRCFSECPKQAINILGKTVYEQSRLEKFL